MLNEFKRMPETLQKQTTIRLGFALLFLVLTIVLGITSHDIYLYLPCVGAVVFNLVAAFLLFRRIILGDYVVVGGACSEIGQTTVKRRSKYMILQTDVCELKVMLHNRMKKIPVGSAIHLYIAKNTPVFEQNGAQILYNYIAMDVK